MSMRSDSPVPDRRPRTDSNDGLARFLGGSPLAVIFRLALLSILVGVILEAVGLDLHNILETVERLYRRIWDMGFDAVRWLGHYLLLGAAVEVPLWFIVRLTQTGRRR